VPQRVQDEELDAPRHFIKAVVEVWKPADVRGVRLSRTQVMSRRGSNVESRHAAKPLETVVRALVEQRLNPAAEWWGLADLLEPAANHSGDPVDDA
jgi:hypothetical protein